ncbi:hypothetical protein B0H16DRAFT_1896176 [Mycena metata]|uniref:Apple domain-containing protein n=1 Tax=Mycena metata TaxID=1033252 RepID=A0AAD7HKW1_9AGAR|nr:hypothetical protein B0H16DRAFT_1896176 [Mycena metata]
MFNSKALLASTLVALHCFASATPTHPSIDTTQPGPDIGTVFAVYPGWDMDNGQASEISNGTELECLQSCSTDTACVAYAYVPYSLACFLKDSFDFSTFTVGTVPVSTGLVGACGTFSPVGPTICFTVPVPT